MREALTLPASDDPLLEYPAFSAASLILHPVATMVSTNAFCLSVNSDIIILFCSNTLVENYFLLVKHYYDTLVFIDTHNTRYGDDIRHHLVFPIRNLKSTSCNYSVAIGISPQNKQLYDFQPLRYSANAQSHYPAFLTIAMGPSHTRELVAFITSLPTTSLPFAIAPARKSGRT